MTFCAKNPLQQLDDEVEKEIRDELLKQAKEKLKKKKLELAQAKRIVANLKMQYDALLLEIGSEINS